MFGFSKRSETVALLSVAVVIAGVGQACGLPLFIASFLKFPVGGGEPELTTGPYFVVWFCSLMFNLLFFPLTWLDYRRGKISARTFAYTKSKRHWKLVVIGVSDALNGIFTVYASSATRVPTALQPILLQAIIPVTLIVSRIVLKKVYMPKQILGAFVVLLSILVYFVPTFVRVHTGHATTHFESGWWWPLILVIGTIPGALMNVAEEAVFEDEPSYNINLLLALESLYQWLTVTALFWTDILKGFGTAPDISTWASQFKDGFICFVNQEAGTDRCKYTALAAVVFTISYSLTYLCGSKMMKLTSANYQGMLSSVINPLAVVFWLIFTGLNTYAGGANYTRMDVLWTLLCIPLMIGGAVMFRVYERDDLTKRHGSMDSHRSKTRSGKFLYAHLVAHEDPSYESDDEDASKQERGASAALLGKHSSTTPINDSR